MPHPDPRTIRRALNVLERLPHEALADLAERLIDRLDAAGPELDLELETDACDAGECGGLIMPGDELTGARRARRRQAADGHDRTLSRRPAGPGRAHAVGGPAMNPPKRGL